MAKKTYVKPTIEFESYQIDSYAYTAGCNQDAIVNFAKESCARNVDGVENVFYVQPGSACSEDGGVLDGTSRDGYCYHIPSDGMTYFNS